MFQPFACATFACRETAKGLPPQMASSRKVWAGVVIAASGNRPPGAQGT